MPSIVIDIDRAKPPVAFEKLFRKNALKQGDTITLRTSLPSNSLSFLAVMKLIYQAITGYLDKKTLPTPLDSFQTARQVLDDLEKTVGVHVVVESEASPWAVEGPIALESHYDEAEPDISGLVVKEPNPKYKGS